MQQSPLNTKLQVPGYHCINEHHHQESYTIPSSTLAISLPPLAPTPSVTSLLRPFRVHDLTLRHADPPTTDGLLLTPPPPPPPAAVPCPTPPLPTLRFNPPNANLLVPFPCSPPVTASLLTPPPNVSAPTAHLPAPATARPHFLTASIAGRVCSTRMSTKKGIQTPSIVARNRQSSTLIVNV